MIKKHTKITLFRPIVIGFCVVYVMSMLLVTVLVKTKYAQKYEEYQADSIDTSFFASTTYQNAVFKQDGTEEKKNEIKMITSFFLSTYLDDTEKYNKISGALYDKNGNQIATADSFFGLGLVNISGYQRLLSYPVFDYFSEEDINEILHYYDQSLKAIKNDELDPYRVEMNYDLDTYVPVFLRIIEQKYESTEKNSKSFIYNSKPDILGERKVWEWSNQHWLENVYPVKEENQGGVSIGSYKEVSLSDFFILPYYRYFGRNHWIQWTKDSSIQSFSKKHYNINDRMTYTNIGSSYQFNENETEEENEYAVKVSNNELSSPYNTCTVLIKNNPQSYLAAMDYMKYIYLITLSLMMMCLFLVLRSIKKAYIKEQQLNQSKQDFINAIAHELKTPLGIIRGFAENIKEHTIEEKETYYLEKMQEQNTVMERLVSEIIDITKLESDSITLKKENISMGGILKEQVERLEPLIKEKKITIELNLQQDFVIYGDKVYLSRMFFNILENAVSYNIQNGSISIVSNHDLVEIENTGTPIKKEDMPYIYDLFYTSDKSRGSKDKHFGLGLYLAKKICLLHHLSLTLENTDTGVKATIRKEVQS